MFLHAPLVVFVYHPPRSAGWENGPILVEFTFPWVVFFDLVLEVDGDGLGPIGKTSPPRQPRKVILDRSAGEPFAILLPEPSMVPMVGIPPMGKIQVIENTAIRGNFLRRIRVCQIDIIMGVWINQGNKVAALSLFLAI